MDEKLKTIALVWEKDARKNRAWFIRQLRMVHKITFEEAVKIYDFLEERENARQG